ncbi:MAG: AbrB/MazE/SpoVT family DNA-binding domain-containing protein [Candidatus Hodarchaeota archaeon]
MSDNGSKKEDKKKVTETRKLVKWGSSETLIMSLPRSWVKKYNLTKESEISLIENPDGSLLVSPLSFTSEKPRFEATIEFDEKAMADDYDYIELMITTKYLDGNDEIHIVKKETKGVEKFPTKFTNNVLKIVQSLLGLEITSLLSTKIKIVDIMSIQESNIDVLVKIIADTTIDFFQSLIDLIQTGDLSSIESLLISKRQVRKYYLRILRELRKGLLVPATLSRMGLTAQDTVDLAFFITDVNETAENLEFMLNTLKGKEVDEEVSQLIIEFMNEVNEEFRKGVDSFLFKVRRDAIDVIKRVPDLELKKRDIENKLDAMDQSVQFVHFQIVLDLNSKILDSCKSISLTALRRIF